MSVVCISVFICFCYTLCNLCMKHTTVKHIKNTDTLHVNQYIVISVNRNKIIFNGINKMC